MQNFTDSQGRFEFPEHLFPEVRSPHLVPASVGSRRAVIVRGAASSAVFLAQVANLDPQDTLPADICAQSREWSRSVIEFHTTWSTLPVEMVNQAVRVLETLAKRFKDPEAAYVLGSASGLAVGGVPEGDGAGEYRAVSTADRRSYLRQALKAGANRAWYRVGLNSEARGDAESAFSRFQRGADRNDSACLYTMGLAYMQGQFGLDQDMERGVNLIELAVEGADVDFPRAPYLMGKVMLGEGNKSANGDGLGITGIDEVVPRNTLRGLDLVERSASLGFAPALLRMAEAYLTAERGFDCAVALRYLSLAACQDIYRRYHKHSPLLGGAPEAQIVKWLLCGYENIVDKNEEWALKFAEISAIDQNPSALFALGYFYEIGIATQPDPERAIAMYSMSSAKGFSAATARLEQLQTGKPQLQRSLTRKDHDEKIRKHRAALMRGDSGAARAAIDDETTLVNEASQAPTGPLTGRLTGQSSGSSTGPPTGLVGPQDHQVNTPRGAPTGPPTGPSTGPPTGPPTGPMTGTPTGPPTGTFTGYPTGPASTGYPTGAPTGPLTGPPLGPPSNVAAAAPTGPAGEHTAPPSGSTPHLPYPTDPSPRRSSPTHSRSQSAAPAPAPVLPYPVDDSPPPSPKRSPRASAGLAYPVSRSPSPNRMSAQPKRSISPVRTASPRSFSEAIPKSSSSTSVNRKPVGAAGAGLPGSPLPHPSEAANWSHKRGASSYSPNHTPINGSPLANNTPSTSPPSKSPSLAARQGPPLKPVPDIQAQGLVRPVLQPSGSVESFSTAKGSPRGSPDLSEQLSNTRLKTGGTMRSVSAAPLSTNSPKMGPSTVPTSNSAGSSRGHSRNSSAAISTAASGETAGDAQPSQPPLPSSSPSSSSSQNPSDAAYTDLNPGSRSNSPRRRPMSAQWMRQSIVGANRFFSSSQFSLASQNRVSPSQSASTSATDLSGSQVRSQSPLRKIFGSTPEQRAARSRADRRSFTEAHLAQLANVPKVPVQPINTERKPGIAYTFEEMGVNPVASDKSEKCIIQ